MANSEELELVKSPIQFDPSALRGDGGDHHTAQIDQKASKEDLLVLSKRLRDTEMEVSRLRGLEWERTDYTRRWRRLSSHVIAACFAVLALSLGLEELEFLRPYLAGFMTVAAILWLTA